MSSKFLMIMFFLWFSICTKMNANSDWPETSIKLFNTSNRTVNVTVPTKFGKPRTVELSPDQEETISAQLDFSTSLTISGGGLKEGSCYIDIIKARDEGKDRVVITSTEQCPSPALFCKQTRVKSK